MMATETAALVAEGVVGEVNRLTHGPVKGLGLNHPDHVDITATGLAGDRRFFLVDAVDTLLSITRTGALTGLTAHADGDDGDGGERLTVTGDGVELSVPVELGDAVGANFYGHHVVPGRVVAGPWAEFFSDLVGQPVRLVRADEPGGGCDLHPVTLLAEASATALAAAAGADVDARRFRMSIGLDGPPPFAEDGWSGTELEIGTAVLRVGGPVKRCAATARHPESGERDLPMLRVLKQVRGVQSSELGTGVNLGVYASVVRPGRVGVGDAARLTLP